MKSGEPVPDKAMKNKGVVIQVLGIIFLFLGLRGFFVFGHTIFYFPSVVFGVVVFAGCLFWGGYLIRKSKKIDSPMTTSQPSVPPNIRSEISVTAYCAFVVSIIGAVFSPFVFGLPFAIAAVILGFMSRRRILNSDGTLKGKWMAVTGIIAGFVGVAVSVIAAGVITVYLFMSAVSGKAYSDTLKLCSDGKQAEAEDRITLAVVTHPNDQRLVFFCALLSRSRWDKENAGKLFERVTILNPKSKEGLCAQYTLEVDGGNENEMRCGIDGLQELANQNPDDPLLLWMLGMLCREHYKRTHQVTYGQTGADAYGKLLKMFNVGPALVHQTYGNILSEELGRHEEALKHYQMVAQMEPAAWSYQTLGSVLYKLGRSDEAGKVFAKAVEYSPERAATFHMWGDDLKEIGRYEDAITKYTKAAELDPGNGLYWAQIGHCYDRLKKPNEAFRTFQKAANEGYVPALCDMGLCYEKGSGVKQDMAKAVEIYKCAAEKGDPWAMRRMGDLYAKGVGVPCDKKVSMEWLARGAEAGDGPSAYVIGCEMMNSALAKRFADKQNNEKIYRLFLQAVQGESPRPEAFSNLAMCYKLGVGVEKNLQKAAECLATAVTLGDTRYALQAAGDFYRGREVKRDFGRALQCYEIALSNGCNGACMYIARIKATSPDPGLLNGPEALEMALKSVGLQSDDYMSLDTLACAYARNNQFAEAIANEKKAIDIIEGCIRRMNNANHPFKGKLAACKERLKLFESRQPYTDNTSSEE